MKSKYLMLAIVGTILPNIFVVQESIETGNIMLYLHPLDTFKGMFANNISSAFVTDLLFIVILFLIWSYKESKKHKIKSIWWIWIYTFAFGIAGGLPLFLHMRMKRTNAMRQNPQ